MHTDTRHVRECTYHGSLAVVAGLFWLGLLLPLNGCVVFNEECSAPADLRDPDHSVGYLAAPLPITESLVRTQEMGIGDLITDAFSSAYNAPQNPNFRSGVAPIDGAIQNAGGIREEGFCDLVGSLPGAATNPPALRRADLREILQFRNRIVVAELNGEELFSIFEHSVAGLADPEDPERGSFLQVSSGFKINVDCSQPAQEVVDKVVTVLGQRIQSIELSGKAVNRADTSVLYRIATNDFLLGSEGNDNFVALAGHSRVNSLGRLDAELVEDYLGLVSSERAPLTITVGGRLILKGCK